MNTKPTYSGLVFQIALSAIALMSLSPISVEAATPTEACSLLSQQEILAAAGFDVGPGDNALKTVCTWGEPGKGAAIGKNVQVSYLSETIFQAAKTMPGAVTKPEPGLGEEAFFVIQRAGVPRLNVRKGSIFFRVQTRVVELGASVSADEQEKEMAIDRSIARLILQKL